MTEAAVSFAGNLTDQPEVRYTDSGIARAMFRVAVSGRREQEPSFFTVVVWRDQAEHAAQSLSKGSPVVVVGRLQQRAWTAEDGSARSTVEVNAEELGPSLRWATATTTRTTRSQEQQPTRPMRWCGTWAKHAGVPLRRVRAVESVGRLFSTPSRPACGRPPAAAVLGRRVVAVISDAASV
jgi:single-strand DNA-binding protein